MLVSYLKLSKSNVCKTERWKEELKCNQKDIIDVLRGVVTGMTGVFEPVLESIGAFKVPSKENNTTKPVSKGKTPTNTQGQGWIVATDENGTITYVDSCGF